MNFSEIEKLRVQVSSAAPRLSGMPKVFLYNYFYSRLFETTDGLLIEAYSSEFLFDFCNSLRSYSPFYSDPKVTEDLLLLLDKVITLANIEECKHDLGQIRNNIATQQLDFNSLLNKEIIAENKNGDLSFPLIGKIELRDVTIPYSSVEKVKIKISSAKEKDSFVFIPSSYTNEQLQEQAKTSLELAKKIIHEYKHKLSKHHEVLIYFENLSAEYDGNSFGVALTIGLIEQLSLLYNLPYIAKVKDKIASTGGIDPSGNILTVGSASIAQKVETVFYSDIKTFILPKKDEPGATEKLTELNEKYPERKLRLVAVDSLTDLLERRNLVGLKKQAKVVRAARGIKRNWIATLSLLFLVLLLIFVYVRDYDDNPAIIDVQGYTIIVKNKTGKMLWKSDTGLDKELYRNTPTSLNSEVRLIDINNDGINEVIFTNEIFNKENELAEKNRVACFDKNGKLLWKYFFHDKVSSIREKLSSEYGPSRIVGVINQYGKKVIYLYTSNNSSFSSAMYSLDALNGSRIGNTIWNSGFILDGSIYDIEKDENPQLIYTFANNGENKSGLAVIDLNKADGQGPTTKDYSIINKNVADFKAYILLPRTDYNKYIKSRRSGVVQFGMNIKEEQKKIVFATNETDNTGSGGWGIICELDFNLKDANVYANDGFVALRDDLVRKKILKPPYTDTKEYFDLIKSQILYWNGKEFVTREKLK